MINAQKSQKLLRTVLRKLHNNAKGHSAETDLLLFKLLPGWPDPVVRSIRMAGRNPAAGVTKLLQIMYFTFFMSPPLHLISEEHLQTALC